ncbi:MAG: hypothetical protein ACKVJC_09480 [Flavobacteriales bacterium]
MTNLIAIILTFSFLFGVDFPKSESQITTDIQFDADTFQENQLIKKEMKKNYKQARKAKSIPKPAGSPIYISNQKSGKALKNQIPAKKVLKDEAHLEKQKNAKQNLDELIARPEEYRQKKKMSERDKKAFARMGHSQQPKTNRVNYYKQKLNELRAQSNIPAPKQHRPTVSGLPFPSQINEVTDIRSFQSSLTPADLIEFKPFQVPKILAGNISPEELDEYDIVNAVELLEYDRSRDRTHFKVAILQSVENPLTVANMANALMESDYEAVPVNPEDIDELDEALYYDAFVIGGSGYGADEVIWAEVYEIINLCVNEYGRGVVHTGWGMYSIGSGSDPYGFLTDMLPININLDASYYFTQDDATALDSIEAGSPLMDGVSSLRVRLLNIVWQV